MIFPDAPVTDPAYHWALPYVGKPWLPGEAGPLGYDCWGLIRAVFADRFGITVPPVAVGISESANVAAIKQAAGVSGWRRVVDDNMRADDVVLMRNVLAGCRHVGIAVGFNNRLFVLHSNGGLNEKDEPTGAVTYQPLNVLASEGFTDFEFWRYTKHA